MSGHEVLLNTVLWVLVTIQGIAILLLTRRVRSATESQHGNSSDLRYPVDQGPQLGSAVGSKLVAMERQRGAPVQSAAGLPTLVLFLMPNCPGCQELILAQQRLASSLSGRAQVVAVMYSAGDGENPVVESRILPVIDRTGSVFREWNIHLVPFGVLIDKDGIVRGKGFVRSVEDAERLLSGGI